MIELYLDTPKDLFVHDSDPHKKIRIVEDKLTGNVRVDGAINIEGESADQLIEEYNRASEMR